MLPTLEQHDVQVSDPPYNYNVKYETGSDNRSDQQYLQFTREWLTAARDNLKPTGTMWVFIPDEWVADLDVIARRELGLHRQAWVVWYFTFGVACANNFARSHTHILRYTKHKKNFTFHADKIRVPSARQAVYGDKRAVGKGKIPDNTWVLHKKELEPLFGGDKDTWLESRICGTFHERRKHSPNQLPLPILQRIVACSTNPGDRVLDPFVGSGGTGVAAVQAGCPFTGIELGQENCIAARSRIASVTTDSQ